MTAQKLVFSFLVLFPAILLQAQHCPFDGSAVVVVKMVDKSGNPVSMPKDSVYLYETDNPRPDSCTYASRILIIRFEDMTQSLLNKYDGSWVSWAKDRAKECDFMQAGHYAVVLNQAETDCMIKRQSDYDYSKRKFEIRQKKKGKWVVLAQVQEESIYDLCTGAGPWKRIKPLLVTAQ